MQLSIQNSYVPDLKVLSCLVAPSGMGLVQVTEANLSAETLYTLEGHDFLKVGNFLSEK